MRRQVLMGVAVGLVSVLAASAQEGGAPTPVKPSAEHKRLRADVGVWEAEVKFYMNGPDAPPEATRAIEINRMMPGGLWLLSEFRGEALGQPFHGRGQTGYDPIKKKYNGTWIDTMSPTLIVLEGDYEESSRSLTMTGEMIDPASGQTVKMRMVSTNKDEDTRTFTMYMTPPGGDEVKGMETVYRKLKGEAARAAVQASQPKPKGKATK